MLHIGQGAVTCGKASSRSLDRSDAAARRLERTVNAADVKVGSEYPVFSVLGRRWTAVLLHQDNHCQ